MKRADLTGLVVGSLTVLRPGTPHPIGANKHRATWVCRCACGKEVEVIGGNLNRKKPNSTSCGCKFMSSKKYNFADLTGKRFGKLLVVARADGRTKTRGVLWKCKCDCGGAVEVPSNSLTSGNTFTCGNRTEHPKSLGRVGEIPIAHINAIKQNATKRNLVFELSPDYLWLLFESQHKKCAMSGVELVFTSDKNPSSHRQDTTASLDRIDPLKGYVHGNVRWVHKDLNFMRLDFTDAEFSDWMWKCVTYVPIGRDTDKWDVRFLGLSRFISSFSKDPSTQVGAAIIRPDRSIVSMGYNGLPIGVLDVAERLEVRETKYRVICHAEKNAITFARQDLRGCTIYTYPFMPCAQCAGMIIQAGIKTVVAPRSDNPRWQEDFGLTRRMLNEAGVTLRLLNPSGIP